MCIHDSIERRIAFLEPKLQLILLLYFSLQSPARRRRTRLTGIRHCPSATRRAAAVAAAASNAHQARLRRQQICRLRRQHRS